MKPLLLTLLLLIAYKLSSPQAVDIMLYAVSVALVCTALWQYRVIIAQYAKIFILKIIYVFQSKRTQYRNRNRINRNTDSIYNSRNV